MADDEKPGLLKRAADAVKDQAATQRAHNTPEAKAERAASAAAEQAQRRQQWIDQALADGHVGTEYRVDQVRETIVGEKIKTDHLHELLNRRAMEGWALKQVIPASVTGRVGPGGTGGLVVVFERELRA